jgi:hypothetical protein
MMKATIKADMKPMRDALREYMRYTRRSLPEILQKQAAMLISGAKGVNGLFQEARSHAFEVRNDIRALLKGWRIKRPKGGGKYSAIREINRRLQYAGLVQSTGWFNVRYGRIIKDGAPRKLVSVKNPRGIVIENLTGRSPYIILRNRTPNAGNYAEKTGYVDRAVENRAKDLLVYVRRKQEEAIAKAKMNK